MPRTHNGPLTTAEVAAALGLDIRNGADARHARRLATGEIRPTWPEVAALISAAVGDTHDESEQALKSAMFVGRMVRVSLGKPGGGRKR